MILSIQIRFFTILVYLLFFIFHHETYFSIVEVGSKNPYTT